MASQLLLLLLLSTSAPDASVDVAGRGAAIAVPEVRLAQLTIEQRVIIRVPMMRPLSPPPPPSAAPVVEWEEHKGPKCIPLRRIRAAAVTSPRGVDLVLRGGAERMRALLERECSPASLYSGFYIEPNADGQLCSGRDSVLARSGAECGIRKLVRLVPEEE